MTFSDDRRRVVSASCSDKTIFFKYFCMIGIVPISTRCLTDAYIISVKQKSALKIFHNMELIKCAVIGDGFI